MLGGYLLDLITVGSEYLKKIQNYRATTESGYWRGGGGNGNLKTHRFRVFEKHQIKEPPASVIQLGSNMCLFTLGL